MCKDAELLKRPKTGDTGFIYFVGAVPSTREKGGLEETEAAKGEHYMFLAFHKSNYEEASFRVSDVSGLVGIFGPLSNPGHYRFSSRTR